MFRLAVGVGEITSAAAGDEDFLARAIGVLDHGDAASTFTRLRRAHQPGGAAAKNQGIELMIHRRRVIHCWRAIRETGVARCRLMPSSMGLAFQL